MHRTKTRSLSRLDGEREVLRALLLLARHSSFDGFTTNALVSNPPPLLQNFSNWTGQEHLQNRGPRRTASAAAASAAPADIRVVLVFTAGI